MVAIYITIGHTTTATAEAHATADHAATTEDREQTSMDATANRWPGPRASSLTQVMAEVEPTKMVYRLSLSCLWSRALRAW